MPIINNCFGKLLQNSIQNVCYNQIKFHSIQNRPRLRVPYWLERKERPRDDQYITKENKHFIKEVVEEKFGVPQIIKGIECYPNSSKLLINTNEIVKQEWVPGIRRTGLVGRQIGHYPLWKKDGTRIDTTVIQITDNHVIKYIKPEDYQPTKMPKIKKLNKFGCLLVGSESIDPSLLTKNYMGLFKDSGVMPKKNLSRFIISPEAALPAGTPLNVTHFRVGDFVDVRGYTVDHGFQGVCVRHGFKGQPASHGVTKTHRRPGNIGGGLRARVWPGTKMPGHMGNRPKVAKGLKIWRINTKYNVMWVQGTAIPGVTNSLVYVFDTLLPLRQPKSPLYLPTYLDEEKDLPEDIWFEDLHDFNNKSIEFDAGN